MFMQLVGIMPLPAPATAVGYLSDGRLVAQTREPAGIFLSATTANTEEIIRIDLGGASVLDTGHEIFHRDAGARVACASCHLEGGDDGHVWRFTDQGPRRTQSLLVGLEGTAPFHWVGDMDNLGTLMEQVFVGRMGGVHQSTARLAALEHWMYSIKSLPPLRAASDPAAARGHELFQGEAECGKCHNGPKLTNNETVDVGTGLALQVPSLVAIGYRAPWIHTGCAKTLQQRFDPNCGSNAHGKTAQLTKAQVDDLVAYLETL
jgi:mono/diheme cytochrome c family protein